jgi:LytS/YehU family sensor histidine kinase
VENGVKHGVASTRGQGWIEISAQRTRRALRLQVKNSVSGEKQRGMGVGHQNIRTRLALLYGTEGQLLFHRDEKVATATLIIPVLPDERLQEKTVRELEPEMRS